MKSLFTTSTTTILDNQVSHQHLRSGVFGDSSKPTRLSCHLIKGVGSVMALRRFWRSGILAIVAASALHPTNALALDSTAFKKMESNAAVGDNWVYQDENNAFVVNLFADAQSGTLPQGNKTVDGIVFPDKSSRVLFGTANGLDSNDCSKPRVLADLFNGLYDTYQGISDLGWGDVGGKYWANVMRSFFINQARSGFINPSRTPEIPSPSPERVPEPYFYPAAKADGVTFDTEALQKAIDACAGTGGSVILEGGKKFLTKPLVLRGNMTLHIEKGAALIGSTRLEDYLDDKIKGMPHPSLCRSLIYAYQAHGLTISGEGEIDGQCMKMDMTSATRNGPEKNRPSLLRIFESKGVTVRNITLRDPCMWTQIYSKCDNLLVDNVTVVTPEDYCKNLDGIDVCDSKDVIIRNCNIWSEDDSICLKSYSTNNSTTLENVLIENNRIHCYRANAIKLGTATYGRVKNITIRNNKITHAKYAGLVIASVDGSKVEDILVQDLEMENVAQPIFIRLGNRTSRIGSIDRITIERLNAIKTNSETHPSCSISGIPEARIKNVTIKDSYIEMPGGIKSTPALPKEFTGDYPQSNMFGNTPSYAFFVRHAENVIFDNVMVAKMNPDARLGLFASDATEVVKNNFKEIEASASLAASNRRGEDLMYTAENYLAWRGGWSEINAFSIAKTELWTRGISINKNRNYSNCSVWSNIIMDTKLLDWVKWGYMGKGDGMIGGELFVKWYDWLDFTSQIPSVDKCNFAIRLADLAAVSIDAYDKLANALGGSLKAGFKVDGELSMEEIKCLFESASFYTSYNEWFQALSTNISTKNIPLQYYATGYNKNVSDLPNISDSAKAVFKSSFDAIQTIYQLEIYSKLLTGKTSPFSLIDQVDTKTGKKSNTISQREILDALTISNVGLFNLPILNDASFL